METITSTTRESMEYGFFINPSTYCKVVNIQSHDELLLTPGIQYFIPWNREDTEIVREEIAATGSVSPILPKPTVDEDLLNWLKVAESAFKFWDNEVDEIWNNV